jgi:selenocysteine lyase/cysteine desulfurase
VNGNYYALSLMEALGLRAGGGAVRAGFLHYNTRAEAERLLAALHRVHRVVGAA